jgi:hypothetical protein
MRQVLLLFAVKQYVVVLKFGKTGASRKLSKVIP